MLAGGPWARLGLKPEIGPSVPISSRPKPNQLLNSHHWPPSMDTIKGLALIATFIGFLTIFAMWVSLWDNVWRVSVEPVRGAIYDTRLNRLGPSPCLRSSWWWWRETGCRLT